MARRRSVFGLPIGKKKARLAPWALRAAGAGLVGVPAAIAASRRAGGVVSSGTEKVRQVSDLVDKVSDVKEAADRHSSKIGKVGAAVGELVKGGGSGDGPPKLSHLIEEHIEVAVPRTEAYNQWTQFEMFPSIVKGAERVEQKARDKVEWTSKIGPSRRTWSAEITEQVPDERIAWKATGGLQMQGVVTFHSLDDELARVLVQAQYDPRGPVETVGNLLRIQRRRVRRDLRLFKHFVELRGEATGAWRSRIAKKGGGQGGNGNGRGDGGRQAARSGGSGRRTAARSSSNGRSTKSVSRPRAKSSSKSSSSKASSSRASSSRSAGAKKRTSSASRAR